jgi:hypothetical protein
MQIEHVNRVSSTKTGIVIFFTFLLACLGKMC